MSGWFDSAHPLKIKCWVRMNWVVSWAPLIKIIDALSFAPLTKFSWAVFYSPVLSWAQRWAPLTVNYKALKHIFPKKYSVLFHQKMKESVVVLNPNYITVIQTFLVISFRYAPCFKSTLKDFELKETSDVQIPSKDANPRLSILIITVVFAQLTVN